MKQKIVVEVHMKCGKCRTKAMEIAATEPGVSSVQITGESKDQVVVTGEGVDSVSLTRCLRKKIGSAKLLSVEEVKEVAKVENNPREKINVPTCSIDHSIIPFHNIANSPQPLVFYQQVPRQNPNFCSIL